MRRFIRLIILVPIAIVLIALAVANRGPVTLSLDPLGGDAPLFSISLPLFIVLFAALLIGVVIGGIAAWAGQGKWRRAARARARELAAIKRAEAERPPVAPAAASTALILPREARRAI